MEGAQHVKQMTSRRKVLRFKRSDDNLKLPENFKVGQAIADGNCFFDSFRQGLEQQLGIEVDVEQLRQYCRDFAQNNPPEWFINAIANSYDNSGTLRRETPDFYIGNILNSNRWGDPKVEGRILCRIYDIKLHVIENQSYRLHLEQQILSNTRKFSKEVESAIKNSDSDQAFAASLRSINSGEAYGLLTDMEAFDGLDNIHQLISSSGPLSLDDINYDDQYTIHIENKGNAHFEPILNKQKIQSKRQSPDPSDYDDEMTPEEELFSIVKCNDSEEEKLAKIKSLFKRNPKLNINFQVKDGDTSLHVAVRNNELKVIELLVEKGAKSDIPNSRRRTQLEVAQRFNRQDIVGILKSYTQLNLEASVGEQSAKRQQFQENLRSGSSSRQGYNKQFSNQPKKLTSKQNSEKYKIQIRQGTTGSLDGHFYEIDLFTLGKLRGDRDTNKFYLATNIDGLGAFDDVVMRYWKNGGEDEKSTTIFFASQACR